MNRRIFFIAFFMLFLFGKVVTAQQEVKFQATFCGKKGGGHYTLEELKNCDLTIHPVDSGFKVISFTLSIYTRDEEGLDDVEVKGDQVPEKYRLQILNPKKKSIFLEHIKAVDKKGIYINLRAVDVRM
jgi:hypothetical protein